MSSETIRKWRPPEEEIVPYKISVSSKYLDLTKRKLELTRLPRELSLAQQDTAQHWSILGTPKAALEPLLDAWLDTDRYDWRKQETLLNDGLPQFRTSIAIPSPLAVGGIARTGAGDDEEDDQKPYRRRGADAVGYRVHFVHKRSAAAISEDGSKVQDAMPLLYVHGYPGSFVEIQKVLDGLTSVLPTHLARGTTTNTTRFHVVAPSVPGCGFSDAATLHEFASRETMRLFDALMMRLGYGEEYVVACSLPGWSVGRWWFVERTGCRAVILIRDGPLPAPSDPPGNQLPMVSYNQQSELKSSGRHWKDVFKRPRTATSRSKSPSSSAASSQRPSMQLPLAPTPQVPLISTTSSAQTSTKDPSTLPQTRAYALCDSPTGLLATTLSHLHSLGNLVLYSSTDILNFTMLSWLPGPEASLRWSHAVSHEPLPATSTIPAEPTIAQQQVKLGLVLYHPTSTNTTDIPPSWLVENGQNIPVTWYKPRQKGHAGLAPFDNPVDFIVDVREFVARLVQSDNLSSASDAGVHGSKEGIDMPVRPRTAIRVSDDESAEVQGRTGPLPSAAHGEDDDHAEVGTAVSATRHDTDDGTEPEQSNEVEEGRERTEGKGGKKKRVSNSIRRWYRWIVSRLKFRGRK